MKLETHTPVSRSSICFVWFANCFVFFFLLSSSSRQASRSPISSRSLSPHSPQVGKATPPEGGTIIIKESKGESSGEDVQMRVQGEEEKEESEKKKNDGLEVQSRGGEATPSVLLQVSEAHLALFPDEDGDT